MVCSGKEVNGWNWEMQRKTGRDEGKEERGRQNRMEEEKKKQV